MFKTQGFRLHLIKQRMNAAAATTTTTTVTLKSHDYWELYCIKSISIRLNCSFYFQIKFTGGNKNSFVETWNQLIQNWLLQTVNDRLNDHHRNGQTKEHWESKRMRDIQKKTNKKTEKNNNINHNSVRGLSFFHIFRPHETNDWILKWFQANSD